MARQRSPGWWRGWRVVALLPLAGLLLACGGNASPTSAPTSGIVPTAAPLPATATVARTVTAAATANRPTGTSGTTATRTASPGASATATRGAVNYPAVVDLAIGALAAETGVPREQIVVARVEPREWPDSSLGCPQPGRAYLQVVTPGYRVFLVAGGREYEYHTNQSSMVIRC